MGFPRNFTNLIKLNEFKPTKIKRDTSPSFHQRLQDEHFKYLGMYLEQRLTCRGKLSQIS